MRFESLLQLFLIELISNADSRVEDTVKVFIVSQMYGCKQYVCQMTAKTHFLLAVVELWGAPSKQKVKIRFSPSAEERGMNIYQWGSDGGRRGRGGWSKAQICFVLGERQKERDRKTERWRKERTKVLVLKQTGQKKQSFSFSVVLIQYDIA